MSFTAIFNDPSYAGVSGLVLRVLDGSGGQIGPEHSMGSIDAAGNAAFTVTEPPELIGTFEFEIGYTGGATTHAGGNFTRGTGTSVVNLTPGIDSQLLADLLDAIRELIPSDNAQTLQIVFDYDGQPVSGVIVRVAGREITSDMLGRVVIDLDPGTYTVKYIVPPNYQTPDEDEITIDTDPVGHTVTLQSQVFPPLDPPLCSCTILAILQDGTPAVDAIVTVHVRERGALDNTAFLFNHEHEYLTDADGLVTIPMLRNHRYDIVVEAEGQSMRVCRLIPDADHYHILVR